MPRPANKALRRPSLATARLAKGVVKIAGVKTKDTAPNCIIPSANGGRARMKLIKVKVPRNIARMQNPIP